MIKMLLIQTREFVGVRKGKSYKDLMEFHKNHIWTYVDTDMNKGWVNISGEEE